MDFMKFYYFSNKLQLERLLIPYSEAEEGEFLEMSCVL